MKGIGTIQFSYAVASHTFSAYIANRISKHLQHFLECFFSTNSVIKGAVSKTTCGQSNGDDHDDQKDDDDYDDFDNLPLISLCDVFGQVN